MDVVNNGITALYVIYITL